MKCFVSKYTNVCPELVIVSRQYTFHTRMKGHAKKNIAFDTYFNKDNALCFMLNSCVLLCVSRYHEQSDGHFSQHCNGIPCPLCTCNSHTYCRAVSTVQYKTQKVIELIKFYVMSYFILYTTIEPLII